MEFQSKAWIDQDQQLKVEVELPDNVDCRTILNYLISIDGKGFIVRQAWMVSEKPRTAHFVVQRSSI